MEISSSDKRKHVAGAIVFILEIWFILSLFNAPLVIPPITKVMNRFWEIFTQWESILDIFLTLGRLLLAMFISVVGGVALGVVGAVLCTPTLKEILKETLKIFQIIPPVAVLIMAIMWFGLNGLPAVFIVMVSLIPLISLQVIDAIENIDYKLVEMGQVFKLSRIDMISHIYIPSIEPVLWSAIIVSLTIGAKMIVMGEVLTTATGIGGQIQTARLDIEPDAVIAWTITMMLIYYGLEYIFNRLKDRKKFVRKNYFG